MLYFDAYPCTTFGVNTSKSYVGVVGTSGSGCHSSINSSSSWKSQENKICRSVTILTIILYMFNKILTDNEQEPNTCYYSDYTLH